MDRGERAQYIAAQIKEQRLPPPQIAVVLGSGWNGVPDFLENKIVVPYASLQEMPRCGVQGHAGNFIFGRLANKNIVVLEGRFHLYEGGGAEKAVLPIEIARLLGAETVVLTNSAGGIRQDFCPGDLMILRDHINMTAKNPLEGVAATNENPVFIDLCSLYDRDLRGVLAKLAKENGLSVHEGVYAQMLGPSYETPAEVRMLARLGADAVGMSTVVEAIYAKYLKMRVVAVSCISNMAAGISSAALDHKDVLAGLKERQPRLSALLRDFVAAIE